MALEAGAPGDDVGSVESAPAFTVDADGRILERSAAGADAGLEVGSPIDASSWFGRAALEALAIATRAGSGRSVGRDHARGRHWLVEASVIEGVPWRARVLAVDATAVVVADRRAVLGKLVHSMQNVSFALLSVLEAVELDHPEGAQLEEYVAHLRDPALRLSATMKHLHTCIVPPSLSPHPVRVEALVEHALARIAEPFRPVRVSIHDATTMLVDVDLMAEVIVAMLESGIRDGAPTLDVDRIGVGHACELQLTVERPASTAEERDVDALWDLASENRFELPLRLCFARAVVLAHGGSVRAEKRSPGRVCLRVRLPMISAD